MNQQMIQAINQIKSIRNPQQAAMQVLQNAARQGNQMAKANMRLSRSHLEQ